VGTGDKRDMGGRLSAYTGGTDAHADCVCNAITYTFVQRFSNDESDTVADGHHYRDGVTDVVTHANSDCISNPDVIAHGESDSFTEPDIITHSYGVCDS